MVRAICVDPAQVGIVWPLVSHWIVDAFDAIECDETFEEVESELLGGRALLWIAVRDRTPIASAVTRLWATSEKKICSVLAVGGEADNWPALLAPIEKYAAAEKCFSVRMEGRRGWVRVFRDYSQPWVVLEKRLNNAG